MWETQGAWGDCQRLVSAVYEWIEEWWRLPSWRWSRRVAGIAALALGALGSFWWFEQRGTVRQSEPASQREPAPISILPRFDTPAPITPAEPYVDQKRLDPNFEVEMLVAAAGRLLDLQLRLTAAESRALSSDKEGARFTSLAQSFEMQIEGEMDQYMAILNRLAKFSEPRVVAAFERVRPTDRLSPPANFLPEGLAESHWNARVRPSMQITSLREFIKEDFAKSAFGASATR